MAEQDSFLGAGHAETTLDDIALPRDTQNDVAQKEEEKEVKESWLAPGEKRRCDDIPDDIPEIRTTENGKLDPRVNVDMIIGKGSQQDFDPITVGQVFKKTARRIPNLTAMKFKDGPDGDWHSINYSQYYDFVIQAAKSFIQLGLEEFHSVCILGFNSPEWMISNLGAMFAGGLAAGIFTTNGPEACHFIANDCKANVIVVEDTIQLDKILQIRDHLPHLKAIIQYKGEVRYELENVYNWRQFMDLGKNIETSVVDEIIDAQKPEQCALLIYTSGTTGNPKGVMLSHDNLMWTTNSMYVNYGKLEFGNEDVVSYLPLSHVVAQIVDIYLFITIGGTVHFAQPDALKGSLGVTLKEVKPTSLFGVPQIYERIMERMQAKLAEIGGIKKKIVKWGGRKGIRGNYNRQKGEKLPVGWSLADKLVFKKVQKAIGLERCKIFVVGSAPIRRVVHDFFMSFNMPLMEAYGMSETCGRLTFNLNSVKGKWRTGSCGPLVIGAHLKIDKPNKEGEGELCCSGRHVFMGYFNNEEKTKEAIDDNGWLHSGDIGKLDKDGFLYITGRIKDLIITADGQNIPPTLIENRIKYKIPFLSNVFVIGDKRKYLTCLVTLLCKMDPDSGEPLDELTPMAQQLLESLGCSCTKVSVIVSSKHPAVYAALKERLHKINMTSSGTQRVQKFIILPKDFSIPGGELGPTMKVRRAMVMAKYEDLINIMYMDNEKTHPLMTPQSNNNKEQEY